MSKHLKSRLLGKMTVAFIHKTTFFMNLNDNFFFNMTSMIYYYYFFLF